MDDEKNPSPSRRRAGHGPWADTPVPAGELASEPPPPAAGQTPEPGLSWENTAAQYVGGLRRVLRCGRGAGMTEFEEEQEREGELYLWHYRFLGDRDAENAAETFGKNHELSKELHRLLWEMDWLVLHAPDAETVRDCADRLRMVELQQLTVAEAWVKSIRMIPDGI